MKKKTANSDGNAVSASPVDDSENIYGNIKNTYRPRVEERRKTWGDVDLAKAAEHFQGKARASNTMRSYAAGIRQFREFCADAGFEVLPGNPEAVRQFLVYLAIRRGRSIATVQQRYAGVRRFYREQVGRQRGDLVTGCDLVRDCLNGLVRELGEAPVRAPALCAADIRRILRKLPREKGGALTVGSLRDRALLLVVYTGAFRRSEAAGLLREDLEFDGPDARVLLRKSKTDQKKEGRWVGIGAGRRKFTCPVRAMRAWFEASPGCTHLFHPVSKWGEVNPEPLQDKGIGRIVKRLAHLGGLDPDAFTAHSLRAGVVTDLNAAGVPTAVVQQCSRHKAANMVARYNRPSDVNQTNFTRRAGL